MTQVDLELLRHPTGPWLLSVTCSPSELTDLGWRLQDEVLSDGIVRRLRGSKMSKVTALFDEIAAALQFPSYFGENWNALDECLTDLDWLAGGAYVLLIENATQVLVDEPHQEFALLLQLLVGACETWASRKLEGQPWDRPPTPFHVVLQCHPTEVATLAKRIHDAGGDVAQLLTS